MSSCQGMPSYVKKGSSTSKHKFSFPIYYGSFPGLHGNREHEQNAMTFHKQKPDNCVKNINNNFGN